MWKRWKWTIGILLLAFILFSQVGIASESCTSPVLKEAALQSLTKEIAAKVEPMAKKGQFGVYIKSLTDNRMIYEWNSEKALIPASNEKIVTSLGAYYLVGPDYRYKTEIYMDERMVIVGDHYFGDLAVKGYGDPMLQYNVLLQMLRETPLSKVKQFHGHLYIDDTAFDDERFGPDWNYDMAKEIGAIIFRNTTLAKTGDTPQTVPTNVGRTMQLILKALKVNQKGLLYAGQPVPAGMQVVASSESEPLLTIMGYGNRASDNSILEQIFKTISHVKTGQGSADNSAELLKEFYAKELGLDPAQYQIVDGCGLSRNNRISPEYLGTMLEYGFYHPFVDRKLTVEEAHELVLANQNPYINTLATAGGDGTLQDRMKGLRVYGKTGTLTGVDALSGYVITASGQVVVFSFLVNDFTVSRSEVREWEDNIVRMIFENY